MQKLSSAKMIGGLLLVVCLVQASHASSISSATTTSAPELKCYICENCAKITKETPIEECDAEFFEKRSRTTEDPDDDDSTTTNAPITTTTTATTTEQTSTELNTETTTLGTTTEAVPTAPTVGPISTTTVVTPINEGTVPTSVFEVGKPNASDSTTNYTTTSADAPKALRLVAEDYSYHCYSVQKNVNGTMSVERGCSRVSTMESVCGQLKAMNMGVQLSKCVPCSNSECNGSSALGVSVAALLFALIAAVLSRH